MATIMEDDLDVGNTSMCILSPPRPVYVTPIPWPSSGRKKHRHVVRRGMITLSKLSTKHSTTRNVNHISPDGNKSFNRSMLNENRRKSIGQLFNKLYKDVTANSFSDRISPNIFDSDKEKALEQPETQGKTRTPSPDVIDPTESDTSPEPLYTRILLRKIPTESATSLEPLRNSHILSKKSTSPDVIDPTESDRTPEPSYKRLILSKKIPTNSVTSLEHLHKSKKTPSPDMIDLTDSDTSPEPLCKRIIQSKKHLKECNDLTAKDSKTPVNKFERPPGWRSCTAPRRRSKIELKITSSEDDSVLLPPRRRGKKSNKLVSSSSESDITRPTTKSKKCILVSDTESDELLNNVKKNKTPKLRVKPRTPKSSTIIISDSDSEEPSLSNRRTKSVPKKTKTSEPAKDTAISIMDKLNFIVDDSDSTSSFDRRRSKSLSVPKAPKIQTKTRSYRKNVIVTTDTDSSSSLDIPQPKRAPKKPEITMQFHHDDLYKRQEESRQMEDLLDRIKDINLGFSNTNDGRNQDVKNTLAPPSSNIMKTPVSNFRRNANQEFLPMSPSRKAAQLDSEGAVKFVKSLLKYKTLSRKEMHHDAIKYIDGFAKHKEELSNYLYSLYNKQCFNNELPPKMIITWKPRLKSTAGYCIFRRKVGLGYNENMREARLATIDLSTKVLDSPDRVCQTLIHEMCHAATWIINGIKDSHHGAVWKNWGQIAIRSIPVLPQITRTHNYEITTKFLYRCTKCGGSIGRHSKSLDIQKKVCGARGGKCLGKFELLQNGKVIQSAVQTKETVINTLSKNKLTPFAKFVQDNYGKVKNDHVGEKHAVVMKKLGELFSKQKLN